MKRLVALSLVISCGGGGNPAELWLAPTDGELGVILIDHAPPDF